MLVVKGNTTVERATIIISPGTDLAGDDELEKPLTPFSKPNISGSSPEFVGDFAQKMPELGAGPEAPVPAPRP
jgi:hypothetical protein